MADYGGAASVSDLPWTYDYQEEARGDGAEFLDKPLLRPVVSVMLANGERVSQRYVALVDSGCDHVLAPAWVAHTIGVEPDEDRQMGVRIGGSARSVRFAEVTLRLMEPGGGPTDASATRYIEWECSVGFFTSWADPPWTVLLGQVGFFDEFTVAFSRFTQSLAVEQQDAFDRRHPDFRLGCTTIDAPRRFNP